MYKQNEILTLIVLFIKIVTSGYVGERNWFFQPDGQGVYTYDGAFSGDVYSGSWKNGEKHGQGVNTYSVGDVYSGSWKNDQMHGQGVYTHSDGSVYSGSWKNDRKHGEGVYTWANGHVYSGSWKNDYRHGVGVMSYASGKQ